VSKKCLAIPTNILLKKHFIGFVTKDFFNYLTIIDNKKYQYFLLRNETSHEQKLPAEQDINFQQPIAYGIIKYKNKIFIYQRAKKEIIGEPRLALKYSIGIGGHIEPEDDSSDLIIQSLKREIQEELGYKGKFKINHKGYLNLEKDIVDKVHFGLIYVVEIENNNLNLESHLMNASFKTIPKINSPEIYERLENWSKVLINNIDKII